MDYVINTNEAGKVQLLCRTKDLLENKDSAGLNFIEFLRKSFPNNITITQGLDGITSITPGPGARYGSEFTVEKFTTYIGGSSISETFKLTKQENLDVSPAQILKPPDPPQATLLETFGGILNAVVEATSQAAQEAASALEAVAISLETKIVDAVGNTTLNTELFIKLLEDFEKKYPSKDGQGVSKETFALYKVIMAFYINYDKSSYEGKEFYDDMKLVNNLKLEIKRVLGDFASQHINRENGTVGDGACLFLGIEFGLFGDVARGHIKIERDKIIKHINSKMSKSQHRRMSIHQALTILTKVLKEPIILSAQFMAKKYARANPEKIMQMAVDSDKKAKLANDYLIDNRGLKFLNDKINSNILSSLESKKAFVEEHIIQSGVLNEIVRDIINNMPANVYWKIQERARKATSSTIKATAAIKGATHKDIMRFASKQKEKANKVTGPIISAAKRQLKKVTQRSKPNTHDKSHRPGQG